jgi:hypothetical protein
MAALAATSAATVALAASPSVFSSRSASCTTSSANLRLSGPKLHGATVFSNGARVVMADATATEAPKGFSPPTLNADTPAPIFGGSTGGLLRKAQVEEFYVITWDSPKEQIFEMPTGTHSLTHSLTQYVVTLCFLPPGSSPATNCDTSKLSRRRSLDYVSYAA